MNLKYKCTNCGGEDTAPNIDVIAERENFCVICETLKKNGLEYKIEEPKKTKSKDKRPNSHLFFPTNGLKREKGKYKHKKKEVKPKYKCRDAECGHSFSKHGYIWECPNCEGLISRVN